MSALFPLNGLPVSESAKPSDTNEATLMTAGKGGAVLVHILVSNNTASAATATVQWNDGTTDWDIWSAKSIAAHSTEALDTVIRLPSEGSVKITSGTGSALTFTGTMIEFGGGNR